MWSGWERNTQNARNQAKRHSRNINYPLTDRSLFAEGASTAANSGCVSNHYGNRRFLVAPPIGVKVFVARSWAEMCRAKRGTPWPSEARPPCRAKRGTPSCRAKRGTPRPSEARPPCFGVGVRVTRNVLVYGVCGAKMLYDLTRILACLQKLRATLYCNIYIAIFTERMREQSLRKP